MALSLRLPPSKPETSQCENAHKVLVATHTTCDSFFKSFEQIRRDRSATGASTDLEQDLLRAMLVFASSGLDALIKQLVNDALPELLARGERDSGPTARFRDFVREKIERDEKLAARLIAENVTAASPQSSTIQWYIRELTSNSLQSKDQVLQIASFFDIKSNVLTDDFDGLKKLFDARNEIIHEMDINFTATNRNRNQRTKKFAVESTNHLFAIAEKFLSEVDNLCSSISQA